MSKPILGFVLLAWLGVSALAEVRLAKVFGDHMVLQRQKPVRIWGTTDPGAQVTVTFAGQTRTVTTNPQGKWLAQLDPLAASGESRELTVKSGVRTVTLHDVLVGEVWITPGQSNMELPLAATDQADIDIPGADYPAIRYFRPVMRSGGWSPEKDDFAPTPLEDFMEVTGEAARDALPENCWVLCSPETAGRFSAVAFYFARTLHGNLKAPISIINPSLGGTHAHTWMQGVVDPEMRPG